MVNVHVLPERIHHVRIHWCLGIHKCQWYLNVVGTQDAASTVQVQPKKGGKDPP